MSALCPNCGEHECDVTIRACDHCTRVMCNECEATTAPDFPDHVCTPCLLAYIDDTGHDPRHEERVA